MHTQFTVSFGQEPLAAPVASFCGLGIAEGWGRWSIDSRIGIRFDRALPRTFEAQIACAVTPANVGRVFTVIAGGCCRKFVCIKTLRHGLDVAKVHFCASEPVLTMEILVPHSDPEMQEDKRRLGLALAALTIVSMDTAAVDGER